MKNFSRLTIGLGLLLGSGVVAMANIVTSDADLNKDFAGSFVTSEEVNSIFSFAVINPEKPTTFTATPLVDDYLPTTFLTVDTGISKNLEFGVSNSVLPVTHTASVADIIATPEPSGLPFLGAGALLIGMLVRRKLLRVN